MRAMGMFSGMKIIGLLCSIIRNKLIAWLIGPAGLGLVTLFNSVIDLVGQTSRLSIDQTAQRDISQSSAENTPLTLATVRRWALRLGLAGMAAMCLLSPLISLWSFDTFDRWPTFCILSVVPFLLTYSSCVTAENQGLRRFKEVALANIVAAVAGLVIVVPLIIWLRIDSILWLVVAYGVTSWAGAYIFRPRLAKTGITNAEITRRGKGFIRLGAQITLALFITQTLNYFFILYLNTFASTSELGIYQSGYTMMNSYIGIIFSALWLEYFPRISASAHSPVRLSLAASHEARMTLLLLTPLLCLLILLINPVIRLIYTSDFLPVTPYIILGAIGTIPHLASWCLAYILLARGDGRTFLVTEILSSVIGLALNIAGFFYGGFFGLGVAYILSYAIYTAMIGFVCYRKYGVRYSPQTWAVIAASFVTVSLVAVLSFRFSPFSTLFSS